jgi:hypothetical protein
VTAPFSDEEVRRYSRQILLREVGGRGQKRLLGAAPRLYCPDLVGELAARYLLRAGASGLRIYAPADRLELLAALLQEEGPRAVLPQPVEQAPPSLRSLLQAAPGCTLALLQEEGAAGAELFWARCTGARGEVGRGRGTLERSGPKRLAEAPAEPAGDAAVLTGSALALLIAQHLLGLPGPDRIELDPSEPEIWRTSRGP